MFLSLYSLAHIPPASRVLLGGKHTTSGDMSFILSDAVSVDIDLCTWLITIDLHMSRIMMSFLHPKKTFPETFKKSAQAILTRQSGWISFWSMMPTNPNLLNVSDPTRSL